ncbi:GNAT family N-acetyltransferase [Corynebacterium sp.]|uniref:GNAT family N-acetyltransferase n=1 Tax=Corynebacterium sp. TaxID=1720 RepID=UPI0026DBC677|nr:GNAT family N-acetyltransferase [Corynebacterium sp.]MDO5033114.1 GNAT family N-acetyltransferase [Corynebacterium sp.]
MTFTLSAASIAQMSPLDVHALYKLRVDIFVHEQQCPYAEIDDIDARPDTLHILGFNDDTRQLAGTARVFPATVQLPGGAEEVAQFGRFAVHPDARKTGLADTILTSALKLAHTLYPGRPVYLEAQAPLVGYYGVYGFEVCGEEFEEDGIPHRPMIRRGGPSTP